MRVLLKTREGSRRQDSHLLSRDCMSRLMFAQIERLGADKYSKIFIIYWINGQWICVRGLSINFLFYLNDLKDRCLGLQLSAMQCVITFLDHTLSQYFISNDLNTIF